MSKAPAFQWYAADYLADERVMQLSLESEAAYVRLLNYCWREGSIPANAAQCAPMCKYADVKIIKPALALFIKSPAQPGRLIHKRLEEERAKQEAYRAKQAEKGAKGGRPPKAIGKPDESHSKPAALPQLNNGKAEGGLDESSSSSTSSSTSSNEDGLSAQPAPDLSATLAESPDGMSEGGRAAAGGRAPRAIPADEAQVFTLAGFREYVKSIGYGAVDVPHYLLQIQKEAEKKPPRPNSGDGLTWEGFVKNYLNNDRLHNRLIYPIAPYTQPGTIPNPQQRLTSPAASPGDLNARIQAQQNQQFVL